MYMHVCCHESLHYNSSVDCQEYTHKLRRQGMFNINNIQKLSVELIVLLLSRYHQEAFPSHVE